LVQEKVNISDIEVPIINEEEIIYYPISFIMTKVLLKQTNTVSLQKEYSQHIKKFFIDYGFTTGGIQEVYCISEEGLKTYLQNSKIGRLNIEQKRAMNTLLEYLHMDVISEDDRFIKRVPEGYIDKYNIYIKDCIEYVLENNPDIVWQKCTKCGNYYPYHINFFRENPQPGNEYPLYTVCRDCSCTATRGNDLIKHPNEEFRIVYNKYGENIYNLYKEHNTTEIYDHWIKQNSKMMPKIINNEEDKLIIIKYCFDKGMFKDYDDITSKVVHKVCNFRVTGKNFIQRIQEKLFGVMIKNGVEFITDIEQAKTIFFDYIERNNIDINDIYNYKYDELIKNTHLHGFMDRCCNNNLLNLIMGLYDNKYPAYKFKINGFKYWDNKQNRIRALKYLIEEDMKIELEKVPLYITLTTLRKNGVNTMYHVCKKYYKNLFEWVNEIYPNKFTELDFDIHYIRNDFDSIEEAELHDIFQKELDNVFYNPRNTERTINIDGMIPDWLAFTPKKCYIIEYFGMAIDRDTDNKRISEYQDKTIMKIERYEEMECYGKVYIYPKDLKDNFKGVYEKLKLIK